MQPTLEESRPNKQTWTYASLTVIDGERKLKPAQVAFDRLLFDTPPHLISGQVEIIVRNGESEHRRTATVLPHDAEATRIPIRMV